MEKELVLRERDVNNTKKIQYPCQEIYNIIDTPYKHDKEENARKRTGIL